LSVAGLLVGGWTAWGRAVPAPGAAATVRPAQANGGAVQSPSFTIVARKYEFSPARIRVRQDDLVKITLVTEDIPHSFTLDALRIAKRASPGHPAVFDFRAELPEGDGDVTYPFYCNLSIDEGCRRMRGELIIERKR
jgi:heme/copper-type cytochrome/quinol oxidase subunit 2